MKLRVYIFRTHVTLFVFRWGRWQQKEEWDFFLFFSSLMLFFFCYACAGICSDLKVSFQSLYFLGRKSMQWLVKGKIIYSCCISSWFYMIATDEPVINQCKPCMPTLFLLCTELGYFLLPALPCGELHREFSCFKEGFRNEVAIALQILIIFAVCRWFFASQPGQY